MTTQITVFWDVMPCGLVKVSGLFGCTCCLNIQGRTSSVDFYHTARRHISEDSKLHLKSRLQESETNGYFQNFTLDSRPDFHINPVD
jgi:hypothetical protein